ncbi:MAG: GNAT family N-acetyltransferase [Myxococcota bacterium]
MLVLPRLDGSLFGVPLARANANDAASSDAAPRTSSFLAHDGRDALVIDVPPGGDLSPWMEAWDALASRALEPNVFHEHWMLGPALRLLRRSEQVRVVLVATVDADGLQLLGAFPMIRRPRYRGLPVAYWTTWSHPYCFLSTPLVDAEDARVAFEGLLRWTSTASPATPLLELEEIGLQGPLHRALDEALEAADLPRRVLGSRRRPVLAPGPDADAYIRGTLSGKRRRNINRGRRRLSEAGDMRFEALAEDADSEPWIRGFLEVEHRGWKGSSGGSLATRTAHRAYFARIVEAAHARGRLDFQALLVDDRPVAYQCNLLAPANHRAAFAFKVAYDEAWARCSPGLVLEVHNIERVAATDRIRWMDACTASSGSVIERLWGERRVVGTLLAATGARGSRLAFLGVQGLRLLREALA